MKNMLEGIKSMLEDIEEYISDLEDRVMEICSQSSENKNSLKIENSLMNLWDSINYTNIYITRMPEKKSVKNVFEEIMAENFVNLKKHTDTQVKGSQSLKQDESKETHHKIYHN